MTKEIPEHIVAFAKQFSKYTVPISRQSGFNETDSQKRGDGDLTDMLGSIMVFDVLGRNNVVCSMDITSGSGDEKDLSIRVKGKYTNWNIKTSTYFPFRDNLNLFVKEEELNKNIFGFMQVFVHLKEKDEKPHVHIAGVTTTKTKVWEKAVENIDVIPNTGGHKGIKIKISDLVGFPVFIKQLDTKF